MTDVQLRRRPRQARSRTRVEVPTALTGAALRLALSTHSPLREQIIEHYKHMLVGAFEAHRHGGAIT
jgi:hypothetical protein